MKIIDIANKYLGEQETKRLFNPPSYLETYIMFGPKYGETMAEMNKPSAAFNLLMACKDAELETLHGDELRTMMNHLVRRDATYPELSDEKYKALLSDLNNEVSQAWSNVRHKWVT
jgi:hypothetical protein